MFYNSVNCVFICSKKNNLLTPNDVSYGSMRIVWWKCKNNHEWKATISSRATGIGCPYCSCRKIDNNNCLAKLYPQLASEWHSTKNAELTPYKVSISSGKKVWWKCKHSHEWQAIISNRTRRGDGCPHCSGRRR